MSESELVQLAMKSAFSFTGTVRHVGASNVEGLAADDRTAIVHVDVVLHAPEVFVGLAGSDIVVQLAPDAVVVRPGQRAAFFTDPIAFGAKVAVREVARLPVAAVESEVNTTMAAGLSPHLSIRRQIEGATLQAHARDADAVVVGTVLRLEKVGPRRFAEHDADWWQATLHIDHVERGEVPWGEVSVLYANSIDVRWRQAPKPRASQAGVWLLHVTKDEQRDMAPFYIIHPEDYQPMENLELVRASGGPQ